MERRQVFDLPPTAVSVTEHQLITRACRCGSRTTGVAPAGVHAPVSYGPRVTAALVYLYQGQFLSKPAPPALCRICWECRCRQGPSRQSRPARPLH